MQVLFELCVSIEEEMKRVVPRSDLSATETRVMRVLSREQGLTQKQLGERTGIHKSQITRAFQSLIKRGLVEKTPNPRDRRSSLVHPTPAVQGTLAEIVQAENQLVERLLIGLSTEEQRQLEQLLSRVVKNLRSSEHRTSAPSTPSPSRG